MKSTVVIPNYNGINYIGNCMKALMREGKTAFNICIVDNGSTDGSLQWIRENCPGIQLICLKENTGFCKAVNLGIKAADTPYVILLNNDTMVEPGFIGELEKAIEKRPRAFSVSAKMVDMAEPSVLDGAGDLYCALGWAFARGKGKDAERFYQSEAEIFSSCGGAAIYRKALVERLGYFDEEHFAYLEDCDLGYRAQLYGYRNYYCPQAVVRHAGSAVTGSRHNPFKVRLSSRNSVYLIYKNMPLWQILINLPLLCLGFLIKFLFFLKKGMGSFYIKGCAEGVRLCRSNRNKAFRKGVDSASVRVCLRIQLMLWINLFRRITG